ncbi:MAG: endonuclease III [Spirochaetes bacterium]|nr:endonuclease III [Spirochaetota bacterium]
MDNKRAQKILSLLQKHYGDVTPDLSFYGLYQLVIAVVLSAQTTDKQVNKVTGELFKKYPNFSALASAKQSDIEKIIKPIGFFRIKSKNIIKLANVVLNHFGGEIPHTLKELMELPGIGRKSANVILSIGFGIPAFAVDTHIIRVANRIGFVRSKKPLDVERALTSQISEKYWNSSHLIFIRHGRMLCTARKPRCGECPINSLCDFFCNTHKR